MRALGPACPSLRLSLSAPPLPLPSTRVHCVGERALTATNLRRRTRPDSDEPANLRRRTRLDSDEPASALAPPLGLANTLAFSRLRQIIIFFAFALFFENAVAAH